MGYMKKIGLVAMTTAALMAIVSSASATNLTSPAGTVYTGTFSASSEGVTKFASSLVGVIECKKSSFSGKVETHGAGVEVTGKLSSLTFTECTGGTVTSPVSQPGALAIQGTSTTGNGTVDLEEAKIKIHGTAVGTCELVTFSTDIGTLTGSSITKSNATLDVKGTLPQASGNPFCPTSFTWTGSYVFSTPASLDVH